MIDKSIDMVTNAVPFLFAALLAALGGGIAYLNKLDTTEVPFKALTFFTEVITSGFVGVITFMLCDAAGWGWQVTAATVAISGHMGARALVVLERGILIPIMKRYGYYDDSETKTSGKEKAHNKETS